MFEPEDRRAGASPNMAATATTTTPAYASTPAFGVKSVANEYGIRRATKPEPQ